MTIRFWLALATLVLTTRMPLLSAQTVGPGDRPAPQAGNETWTNAHTALIDKAKRGNIALYFAGDSITRRWEATHKENWDHNFAGWQAADFGAGGDRTENLLYRLLNGELDGVDPKVVVLLIGTNNVGFDPVGSSDDALVSDTVRGITACVGAIRRKAPGAKILLMGITPRNTKGSTAVMPTINKINRGIAALADGSRITFLDIGNLLADATGTLFEGMTDDGLHLTDKGYQVWADAMRPVLTSWLGPRATN